MSIIRNLSVISKIAKEEWFDIPLDVFDGVILDFLGPQRFDVKGELADAVRAGNKVYWTTMSSMAFEYDLITEETRCCRFNAGIAQLCHGEKFVRLNQHTVEGSRYNNGDWFELDY